MRSFVATNPSRIFLRPRYTLERSLGGRQFAVRQGTRSGGDRQRARRGRCRDAGGKGGRAGGGGRGGRAVGGGCTHGARSPARRCARRCSQLLEIRNNPLFAARNGQRRGHASPSCCARPRAVIAKQVAMRRGFYERNHVTIVHGHGDASSMRTRIEVAGRRRAPARCAPNAFILATGSRPYRPGGHRFPASAHRRQRHDAAA